jgi:glycosyltransferase involved in cell wall biosynthesis
MDKKPEISIVIPCYNSEKSLTELNKRLIQSLSNMNINYEIIYINDCSKDNTLNVLKKLSEQSPQIKVIDLMFNIGQFRALYCGLETAKGEFIVTMDDDLQHPPKEIKKLYNRIKNDETIDAVFGKYITKEHSTVRNLGSSFIKFINEKVYNKPKHLTMSAFRIMRKNLVCTIIEHRTISPVIGAIILKSTDRIVNVEVMHEKRKYGKSNYNLFKLFKATLDNVLNFSSLPLQTISLIGIAVSFLSFFFSLFYLIRYFFTDVGVPGWTSLMVLLNFYAGLILISLGLIGEYLIRILMEVNGTPKYKIRQIYSQNNGDKDV